MDLLTLVLFLIGFVLLLVGAELLVRGAAALAAAAGVSQLVVGLTVVAYGTSAPELAVTIGSTYAVPPQPDLAVGNVIGSNIANVLLVLGISALVAPLTVARQLVRRSVPLMIVVSLVVWGLGFDGKISGLEGMLLFTFAVAFTAYALFDSRRVMRTQADIASLESEEASEVEPPDDEAKEEESAASSSPALRILGQLALMAVGLGMLLVGANWLVKGAVMAAEALGVSELVIGLTIVAIGTSLPEIATSIVAGLRGQRDIAVGNVVGSNIFNLSLVLGLCAVAAPDGVEVSAAAINFDMPVMIAVALACLPVFFTGYAIGRWEGLLFLAYYVAYAGYLFLRVTEHEALGGFNLVMLGFVAPLTAVTLLVLAGRSFWRKPVR